MNAVALPDRGSKFSAKDRGTRLRDVDAKEYVDVISSGVRSYAGTIGRSSEAAQRRFALGADPPDKPGAAAGKPVPMSQVSLSGRPPIP